MKVEDIHKALEEGKIVNWIQDLYELEYVDCDSSNKFGKLSYKNGKAIRVTCTSNGFGSLLHKTDLEHCYIK